MLRNSSSLPKIVFKEPKPEFPPTAQGLLWALKRAKPCRGRALQVPGMEANRIPVTRGTNGRLWQIRTGYRDRCTNQTLTVPAWVVDRGDLRSVQIESVFGEK